MATKRKTKNPTNGTINRLTEPAQENLVISAPDMVTAEFKIVGTAPYVQNKFPAKVQRAIKEAQEAGSQAKSKKKRDPKNFQECFEAAQHLSQDGWHGIPAPAFRSAMIRACSLVGFKMTQAKMSIFVEADGFDATDGTPLVRIIGDSPTPIETPVRIAGTTMDLRIRPIWYEWGAVLRVKFDRGQFSETDVANLLMRAGLQVGVGEGRPSSKSSDGMGWGTFTLE